MKQEDTRQKILAKALELFSVHGYDAVSVGQIAAAVGIKAPSLYNPLSGQTGHFDAIIEATAARRQNRIPTGSRHPCAGCGAGHSCFAESRGRPCSSEKVQQTSFCLLL